MRTRKLIKTIHSSFRIRKGPEPVERLSTKPAYKCNFLHKSKITIIGIILYLASVNIILSQVKEWEIIKEQPITEKIIKIYNEKRKQINIQLKDSASPLQEIPEDAPIRIVARQEMNSYKIIRISATELIWASGDPIREKMVDTNILKEIALKNYFWSTKSGSDFGQSKYIDDNAMRDIYCWTPAKFEIEGMGRMELRIDEKWAFEFKLGNEEFGLPALTSGTFRISLNNQSIKMIAQFPTGVIKNNTLLWGRNVMDASFGGGIAAEMNHWGGLILFSDLRNKRYINQFRDDNNILSMPFYSLLYYTFSQHIPGTDIPLRFKVGASFAQVQKDEAQFKNTETTPLIRRGKTDYYDAYLRVEYMNDARNIELFSQISSLSLLLGGGYNFTSWFGLSARFCVMDLGIRDRQPLIDNTYISILPRIRF
jgi:hypothetical protein